MKDYRVNNLNISEKNSTFTARFFHRDLDLKLILRREGVARQLLFFLCLYAIY